MKQLNTAIFKNFKKLKRVLFANKKKKRSRVIYGKLESQLAKNNLIGVLNCFVELENNQLKAPIQSGKYLLKFFKHKENYEALEVASKKLLIQHPKSCFLIYLNTFALCKQCRVSEANDILLKKMKELKVKKSSYSLRHYRTRIALLRIWKILDKEARDNMEWLANEAGEVGNYKALESLPDFSKLSIFNLHIYFLYSEPLLQGKCTDAYLSVMQTMYDKSWSMLFKLLLVMNLTRTGIRRLPNYHQPYGLAKELFEKLFPKIHRLLDRYIKNDVSENLKLKIDIKTIRLIYAQSQKLGYPELTLKIRKTLYKIAVSKNCASTRYVIAHALLQENFHENLSISNEIVEIAESEAISKSQVDDFLNWACISQSYDKAKQFYASSPEKIDGTKAAIIYAKVLQRLGEFSDAHRVLNDFLAISLATPHQINMFQHWTHIRTQGELKFAADTAEIFNRVAQPSEPKGVLFTTFRSLEQMRRAPLIVMQELKKMGYAVMPLVNGLIPVQPIGNPLIDQFAGCISLEREFVIANKLELSTADCLEYDVENARLKWGECDLSHALWEEAAIKHRMYNIDYTCPAVQQYLNSTVKWTKLSGIILEKIQATLTDLNINCGFIINFNHRLPDLIYRMFCQHYGDPQSFYCLHFANGYQNYFTNFSTNISTKGVIRNMTLYHKTRAASVPIPEMLEEFFNENKHRKDEIINKVIGNAKVKRSTKGRPERSLETQTRIHEWKARGRKIACAFGKVVCDSSVPFDGGPAHDSMKDWLNHTIECARGSNTLLLIKPHPHEKVESIGCFLNECFTDLIDVELSENVIILGYNWFDLADLAEFIDLGLVYNGTSCVELGILGVPCVLGSYFAPIDYAIGHVTPADREEYKEYVRFEKTAKTDPDLIAKSACWLHFMSGDSITLDYRYHARPITNKVLYPSWWFREELENYFDNGDKNVHQLALSAVNQT